MVNNLKRDALRGMIQKTEGKMFSVEFLKADKSLRKMNCRLKVKKHLKGGESTTSHCDNLITVYDVVNKGYRSINLDTLQVFKFQGKTFNII